MGKSIGFAVVGLGMGAHHAMAVSQARGADLVAVCDTDPDRRVPLAKQYACKGYERYADLLRDPDVQAVCIATESAYHSTMGIQAARAGKHILVEKPVDITPARILRLEAAVRKANIKCGCVFQLRMDPCNRMLKAAVDAGKLGRIIGVHAGLPWFRGDAYYAGPHGEWHGTWRIDGGGSMMNQGIHTVDLMTYYAGPVTQVCGFFGKHTHAIESEDHAVACFQFAQGALGTLYTTTCSVPEGAQQIYCFGEKGSFKKTADHLDLYAMGSPKEQTRMIERFGTPQGDNAIARDAKAVTADGHVLLVEDLVKAIRDDREPIISLASARHAVEIVHAVYQSARTGRTIQLPPQ